MIERRVFGTENEWSLQLGYTQPRHVDLPEARDPRNYKNGTLLAPGERMVEKLIRRYLPDSVQRLGEFTCRGGRFYDDHTHPETSTPEQDTLRGLVLAQREDEAMVLDTFTRAVNDESTPLTSFRLSKRLLGRPLTTASPAGRLPVWGAHENYQVLRTVLNPREAAAAHASRFAVLGLHFATRGIYAGAGAIRDYSEGHEFVIAQKATALTHTYSQWTTYEKPLINLRDVPYGDEKTYARLHVVCGDALLSGWSVAMGVGTTKLIIDALEAGLWPEGMPLVAAERLFGYARQVARDRTFRSVLHGSYNTRTTAIPIQYQLLDLARRYVDQCTVKRPDDVWVVRQWEHALRKLEEDPSGLADRADWPKRLAILTDFADRKGFMRKNEAGQWEPDWDNAYVQAVDLRFDEFKPGSIVSKLRTDKNGWGQWEPAEATGWEDASELPRVTARRRIVRQFAGRIGMEGVGLAWDRAVIPGRSALLMPDPRHVDQEKLGELLA